LGFVVLRLEIGAEGLGFGDWCLVSDCTSLPASEPSRDFWNTSSAIEPSADRLPSEPYVLSVECWVFSLHCFVLGVLCLGFMMKGSGSFDRPIAFRTLHFRFRFSVECLVC